jgi:glycosyltransferase involved in cell wall biosynthesis
LSRTDTPEISVIMPVYNGERYLEPALRSLLEQDVDNVEFTIVDDGSTDKSAQMIEDILSTSGKLNLIHKSNGGIVSALNAAVEGSTGKYLARMDADDISRFDRLRLQAECLDSEIQVAAVGSLCRTINAEGAVIGEDRTFQKEEQTDLTSFPPRVVTLPHPSTMFRASVLRAVGGYRPYYRHAEDFDIFARIGRIGSVRVIQQHLLDYRVHEASISSVHIAEQREAAFLALLDAICEQRGLKVDHQDCLDRAYFSKLLGREDFQLLEAYKNIRDLEDPRGRNTHTLRRAWRSALPSSSAFSHPRQSASLLITAAKLSARYFRYEYDHTRQARKA